MTYRMIHFTKVFCFVGDKMKILFISLGCDKNLVDSEHMIGLLGKAGYEFTSDETEADIIIINSCSFIKDAKEESIETIFNMARMKEEGNCKALVLAGCLAQRYHEEIKDEIPEIDIVVGTTAIDDIVTIVEDYFNKNEKKQYIKNINLLAGTKAPRGNAGTDRYAYLKIAEGCDKHCTYCIIPKIRGDYRSVPMEDLIAEAKDLAKSGIRELILVAQETTMYGKDIYGEKRLHILLKELCKIEDIEWIRVLYCYPEEIYDELIHTIASEEKICNYLDIPIQHASDNVLKRMGRRTTNQELRDVIAKLRKEIPDIVLRTTLITGFPGETQMDHEILMNFVDEMEFERLGVFTYSKEEGTPAEKMENQIPEEVKEERRDEIMELQQEIAFDFSEKMIGKVMKTYIEGKISGENAYIARTYMDIPGVDSNVFVMTDEELMTGDFVNVLITGSNDYDLIGELQYK